MENQPLSEVMQTATEGAFDKKETSVLVKTPALRALKIKLPSGKELPEHSAPGEITVHCLTGQIEFVADGQTRTLRAGQLIHLQASIPHSVKAIENSALLVTIAISSEK